jgi:hypothetical protein
VLCVGVGVRAHVHVYICTYTWSSKYITYSKPSDKECAQILQQIPWHTVCPILDHACFLSSVTSDKIHTFFIIEGSLTRFWPLFKIMILHDYVLSSFYQITESDSQSWTVWMKSVFMLTFCERWIILTMSVELNWLKTCLCCTPILALLNFQGL